MNTCITAHNPATINLARTAARVAVNDNATALPKSAPTAHPALGARVEVRGMCCEGARDQLGTVAEVQTTRWGTSYRIALDEGGEEWASSIEARGTFGASFRYV